MLPFPWEPRSASLSQEWPKIEWSVRVIDDFTKLDQWGFDYFEPAAAASPPERQDLRILRRRVLASRLR